MVVGDDVLGLTVALALMVGGLADLAASQIAGMVAGALAIVVLLRVLLIDATASAGLDSTAATAFLAVRDDLQAAGVALWVVNIQEDTWQRLVATLEATNGATLPRFNSLDEAVASFEQYGSKGLQAR